MQAAEIIEALQSADISCSELAEALDVSAAAVSQVINRKSRSTKIARGIAAVLNRPVQDVFPDISSYAPQSITPSQRRAVRVERLRVALAAAT